MKLWIISSRLLGVKRTFPMTLTWVESRQTPKHFRYKRMRYPSHGSEFCGISERLCIWQWSRKRGYETTTQALACTASNTCGFVWTGLRGRGVNSWTSSVYGVASLIARWVGIFEIGPPRNHLHSGGAFELELESQKNQIGSHTESVHF